MRSTPYDVQRACSCEPWCGIRPCPCGEDHGGCAGLCRDCDLDQLFAHVVACEKRDRALMSLFATSPF